MNTYTHEDLNAQYDWQQDMSMRYSTSCCWNEGCWTGRSNGTEL